MYLPTLPALPCPTYCPTYYPLGSSPTFHPNVPRNNVAQRNTTYLAQSATQIPHAGLVPCPANCTKSPHAAHTAVSHAEFSFLKLRTWGIIDAHARPDAPPSLAPTPPRAVSRITGIGFASCRTVPAHPRVTFNPSSCSVTTRHIISPAALL